VLKGFLMVLDAMLTKVVHQGGNLVFRIGQHILISCLVVLNEIIKMIVYLEGALVLYRWQGIMCW